MLLLEHMGQKDKPFRYIDTHAGAGRYLLRPEAAAEWHGGIGCLRAATSRLPPSLVRLRDHVDAFNPAGRLEHYPGSPWWAWRLCRGQDELRLFEWHPADARTLSADSALAGDPRTRIWLADGLEGLRALLPPPSRRALVMIDPPYETRDEYDRVVAALEMALARFASGSTHCGIRNWHRCRHADCPNGSSGWARAGCVPISISIARAPTVSA